MQMDVHKALYCFYTTKKRPIKARAPFASIFNFKIVFKWSFIRVCHKSVLPVIRYSVCWIGAWISLSLWTYHRRRKEEQDPLDFENLTKKGCFVCFEWEKANFTPFGPP